MKNLSVKKLRKIILEEIAMMLNDDVLFSLDQVQDTGTGTVVYDDDDMLYPYDDEESEEYDMDHGDGCNVCGGHHDKMSPCPSSQGDTSDLVAMIAKRLMQ